MKTFKHLMLATAAISATAPVMAADLNIAAVNQYATSEQVSSITQLSDVKPTDWAYQALSSLVDRYGCVAGYENGTYLGGKAMTRFEAAALLNACLDRVTEVTDELTRLMKEFQDELEVIRGRVAKLETQVGQLQATQFSTTTKLKGEAYFTLNGVDNAFTKTGAGTAASNIGHTAFNYDLRLMLDTSFTGKDLFRTRLRAGNYPSQPFGSSSSLFKLDKATNTTDAVKLDRLYYSFPALAKGVTLTAGALMENNDFIWKPTAYSSQILDFFTGTAGAPGVFNKAEGAGFGVQYAQPGKKGGIIAGVNYVAQSGSDNTKGVFDETSGLNIQAQLGYRAPQWGTAFSYRYGTEGTRMRNFNAVNGASAALVAGQTSNNYAINAFWQPKTSGIIPSVSGAYGWSEVSANAAGQATPTGATNAQTWFAGLQWSDVFAKGNAAGIAYGQPGNSTAISADATMLEIFYKYKVSDNISVTPAVFYVSNNQAFQNNSSNWGGVIQTKFTF